MRLACIPAYNEESNIENLVQSAKKHVDQVIVCDDGSTDETVKLAKKSGAIIISHNTNRGYGAAIISLFEYARENNAEIMITLDGDGQHNPDQIPLLLNTLTQHNVDVVIGSRFLNQNTEAPGYRQRGIKIITSAANYGTDLKVSGGIQMIIEKALTKDLDRRYQNITDMLTDLKLTESRVVGPGSQFVDSGETAAFDEPHSRAKTEVETDDEKCDVRKLFKNIKFGYAAAETEGSRAPELLQYAFLDQFGAVENTLSGNQFLLLGPKGSGKSAIAEKMRLIAETRQDLTVKIRRLSTFPYKLFGRIVAGKEEAQVRYPRAWDWLLLVTLHPSCSGEKGAQESQASCCRSARENQTNCRRSAREDSTERRC